MVKNGFAVDCIGVLQCNVSLCYVSYIALITLDGRGFRVMSLRLSKFVYDIFVRSVKLGGLVPCVLHDVVHQMSCAGDRRLQTLRTQDGSDSRHFGTIILVLSCPDSLAPVPKRFYSCLTTVTTLALSTTFYGQSLRSGCLIHNGIWY